MADKNMKYIIFLLISCFLMGCFSMRPLNSISDCNFIVFPHVVKKQNQYFLRYQLDRTMKNGNPTLLLLVSSKAIGDKLFYFFSASSSSLNTSELIEIPLEKDGATRFAKKDAVFWLNQDQTEVKLKIIEE